MVGARSDFASGLAIKRILIVMVSESTDAVRIFCFLRLATFLEISFASVRKMYSAPLLDLNQSFFGSAAVSL